jgi:hypothetical protein
MQQCTPSVFGPDNTVFQDIHCHVAECTHNPKPGDKKWGKDPSDGCDPSISEAQCCSDGFLTEFWYSAYFLYWCKSTNTDAAQPTA